MKTTNLLKIVIMILIVSMAATNAKADKYYSLLDNGVLTIYYGTPTTEQTKLNTYHDLSAYMDYQYYEDKNAQHINKVVIDRSMRNQQPSGINHWFRNLQNLEEVTGLGFLSTKGVTILDGMFQDCPKLRKIEFSTTVSGVKYTFSTATITSMFGMFSNCKSLRTLDLSTFDTKNVTRTGTMFQYCSSLQTILVGNDWNMSKVTGNNGRDMFGGCNSLCGKIKYSSSNTNNQTFANTDNYLLSYTSTKTGYATILNGTTLMFCYDNYYNANSEMCFELNSEDQEPGWISQNGDITNVIFNPEFHSIKPTSFYKWFYQCTKLTSVEGVENLIMYNATNLAYMFYECSSLQKLDLSSLNTSTKVDDFSYMFYNCKNLSKLKLMSRTIYSDTRYCNMSYMFAGCSALTSSNFLEGFHIEKVKDLSHIFSGCSSINGFPKTGVAGEHINVSLCENLSYMFSGCSSVQDLSVLKYFNTSSVTNMECMFMGCSNITELRLESFDTKRVTQMKGMFGNCSSLKLILVSPDKWSIENVTSSAACFSKCTSLVGGKGTTFSSASGSYARIDQGPANPGYLTPYESSITYTLNGGTTSGNPTSYTIDTETFTLNNSTRAGHEFVGWSGTGITGKSKSVKIPTGSTYPREYTAHWICDLNSSSNTAKVLLSSAQYDGSPITYTITVNNVVLHEGTDYTLSNPYFAINGAGSYTLTINGVGDYKGSKTFNFTITKAPKEITPVVKLESSVLVFTGSPLEPKVKVFDGDTEIASSEYTVTYSSNTGVGKATVTISDKPDGEYIIKTVDMEFSIVNPEKVFMVTYQFSIPGYADFQVPSMKNEPTTPPAELSITGYTLDGVFKDDAYHSPWNFDNDIVTDNITLYAKFSLNLHTLTFVLDGTTIKSDKIAYNAAVTYPSISPKAGHKFSGWDQTITTMPDHDVTISGGYSPNPHKVTFTVGGEVAETVNSFYGQSISKILPVKDGYVFVPSGDYPATVPDEDISIAGGFEIGTFTIYYKLDYEDYEKISLVYGSAVEALPDPPAKTGCTFSGWGDIPTTMPGHNVYIYGSYVKNKHTVTFYIDGEVYRTLTVAYGDKIYPPSAPYRNGTKFSGWNGVPETMPDNDVEIRGSFATPVASVEESSDTKVWAYGHTICIETAPDTKYQIIDLSGRVITTSSTKSNHDEINLSRSGIFIIVAGGRSYKVSVR